MCIQFYECAYVPFKHIYIYIDMKGCTAVSDVVSAVAVGLLSVGLGPVDHYKQAQDLVNQNAVLA